MNTANYRLIWRGAMLFLLVALLLYAANFAYHAFQLARARGEINYAESTWLFAALRVRHGLTPYFDYTHAPYIPMVYTPLLPGLSGWLGALLGISDRQTMTLTRLFSLASGFAITFLITLLCRLFRVGLVHSMIAGLLFLTPAVTFTLWSVAARSDLLAVALGLTSIVVTCFAGRNGKLSLLSILIAGILCGLAISAKQTAVAPLLALGLWFLFGGAGIATWRGRAAQVSLLVLGALVGFASILAPFGLEGARQILQGTLDLATHPQFSADFYTRLDDFVRMFGICLPLSVVGIWWLISDRSDEKAPATSINTSRLVLFYIALSAVLFLATAAKLGSASSYALESAAVLCVAVGIGINVVEKVFNKAEQQVAMALFILAIVPLATQSWYAIKIAQSTQELGPNDAALAELAQTGQGPVLSENGYILLNGADPPYLLDPLFFSVQQRVGKWDPAPVIAMVEERKFVSVVLFHTIESRLAVSGVGWLPDGLYDALARNYEIAGVQGRFNVYLPRKP